MFKIYMLLKIRVGGLLVDKPKNKKMCNLKLSSVRVSRSSHFPHALSGNRK